tara:strand:- start:325 stop:1356 length:1032 start_codon:yes stop_codon:yes gene_type:complete
MTDPNVAKRAAAYAAANLVQDGTTIGLGSGSTFLFVLERLAERIRDEGLKVRGTPTSNGTATAAEARGIPLVTLDEIEQLDLAIDGADEVDPHKNLIKGGGAAHTRERIVAATAKELVVIVGENKMVDVLGSTFRLPVEVLPFGWTHARRRVEATGCKTELRQRDGQALVTDNGNWILDCSYPGIPDPASLAKDLDSMVGVVDHGLFVGMTGRVVIANDAGDVRILSQLPIHHMAEQSITNLTAFETAIKQPRVLLLKHSPLCPISSTAYAEFKMFQLDHPDAVTLVLNVASAPVLSHDIARQCGIEHESPQAILFEQGRATWSASHAAITVASLEAAFAPKC